MTSSNETDSKQAGEVLPATIKQEDFLTNLFALLDETFENHHGIFLDRDTSLFPTLETVSAEEASIPVGGKCASLAAQVAHVTFYLEVLERYLLTGQPGNVDWGEIWRTTREVTPAEWDALRGKLRATYQGVRTLLDSRGDWSGENDFGGALAIIVHTAYHFGEIRQALCTVK